MAASANRQMSAAKTMNVSSFTPEEHKVLASWFGIEPLSRVASELLLTEALLWLGVTREATWYSKQAAAVAAIVLERVWKELPGWNGDWIRFEYDHPTWRHKIRRRVQLRPQHLLTINWADTGPGISWPEAYYLTWVPSYKRYVVTVSQDTDEFGGYCDFALGSFHTASDPVSGAAEVIIADWHQQCDEIGSQRWQSLLRTGLICEEQAKDMADRVWPPASHEKRLATGAAT